MTDDLRAYIVNKVTSIGLPVLIILGSLMLLGYTELQWQFILIVLIACGYTHFIIGFIYQWKAFFKKPGAKKQVLTFFILTVMAILMVELIVSVSGYSVGLFVGFIYFLLHGLFNEQTLIKREAGIDVSLLSISSVMVLLLSLLIYSVPDPTALFDRTLEFVPVDNFVMNLVFAQTGLGLALFSYVFWGGVVLSVVLLTLSWLRERNTRLVVFLSVILILILLCVVVWGSLPYIYVYFIVVGYHLVTWFIFYLREFNKRAVSQLRTFLWLHVIVILPFLFAGWMFFVGDRSPFVMALIDYKYYVYATFIHITTSFMNDTWFKLLQEKLFSLFERISSQ